MHFAVVFFFHFRSLFLLSLSLFSDFGFHAMHFSHHKQIGLAMVAVSTLVISGVVGYTAMCVTAWGYGLALGCYRYTLKMLALERVRAKHFTKAWGKQSIFVFSALSASIKGSKLDEDIHRCCAISFDIIYLNRFYTVCRVHTGVGRCSFDGIFKWFITSLWTSGLLCLLRINSNLSHSNVLHRLSQRWRRTTKFIQILGKWFDYIAFYCPNKRMPRFTEPKFFFALQQLVQQRNTVHIMVSTLIKLFHSEPFWQSLD